MLKNIGLDNNEGLFVGDVNRCLVSSATSINNLASKIDRNSSNLSVKQVKKHVLTTLKNSYPMAELEGISGKMVTRSQNRLLKQFRRSVVDLMDVVK